MANDGTGDLVNGCATKHGVTPRAVRKWRDSSDERWTTYISENSGARKATREERIAGRRVIALMELPGLRTQLDCIERECQDLVARLQPDDDGNLPSLEACAMINRMLDVKRDTWRKLAKDVPPIEQGDGSAIPVDEVVKYAVEVRSLVETLDARISSVMPHDLALDVKQKVREEIDKVLELVAAITIQ